MVEYDKNVNIRYVIAAMIAMTFQLHSKFFQEEHVYFTDLQNKSINDLGKP